MIPFPPAPVLGTSPATALVPPLYPPAGAERIDAGGGGVQVAFATELSSAELEAHYAQQLAAAGWRRQAGGADGLLVWSNWQARGDVDAQTLLYALQWPTANRRLVALQVDSADPALAPLQPGPPSMPPGAAPTSSDPSRLPGYGPPGAPAAPRTPAANRGTAGIPVPPSSAPPGPSSGCGSAAAASQAAGGEPAPGSSVVYGYVSAASGRPSKLLAVELPAGRLLGCLDLGPSTEGSNYAVAPDGHRVYLLDRDGGSMRLSELEAPTLRVLRRTAAPEAIPLAGTAGQALAVSSDGALVYVTTLRPAAPRPGSDRGAAGQAEYGIALYNVARGAFTRSIPLESPECGTPNLYPLIGVVQLFCPTARDLRTVDVVNGRQVQRVVLDPLLRADGGAEALAGAVPTPLGSRFRILLDSGLLLDVDPLGPTFVRRVELGGGAGQTVPAQTPRFSADRQRLFVRAAPGAPEAQAAGLGTVVWVVDAVTLERIAEVPLPAPASAVVPTPDGTALVASTAQGTLLVEVPSGRQLATWPDRLSGLRLIQDQ